MKRLFFAILLLLLPTLAIFFLFIWNNNGLKEYVRVTKVVNKLPQEEKVGLINNFLKNYDQYSYSGILAGINTKLIPGIWVWGSKGLKFFKTDIYSVYSYFKICNENTVQAFENNQKFEVNRNIDTDLKIWKKKVKNGQYVFLTMANPENGGKLGNLREIQAHDWMAFMPSDIKKQCEK